MTKLSDIELSPSLLNWITIALVFVAGFALGALLL